MNTFILANGVRVKDKITGFTGTILGRADYISGCNRYLVMPKGNKNEYPVAEWFDEQRLTLLDSKVVTLDNSVKRGADMEAPKK